MDENGTIEFNEFLIMLKKKMKDPGEDAYKTEEEMIKEAFQKFDVNKTGTFVGHCNVITVMFLLPHCPGYRARVF